MGFGKCFTIPWALVGLAGALEGFGQFFLFTKGLGGFCLSSNITKGLRCLLVEFSGYRGPWWVPEGFYDYQGPPDLGRFSTLPWALVGFSWLLSLTWWA